MFRVAAQDLERRPGGHDKGHHQRKEHRRARADRNRPHVRAHQAADERHRQHGGDHRPGGEDRWVAHLIHRLDGDLDEPLAPAARQAHVAHDVLDHHDRVVHQDADGEDQREERDPVERVAVEVEDEQREAERHRDREHDDQRLAPAEEEQDEHGHAEDGDAHVQEQLVRFLARGGAVVAGDRHPHVGRDERALEAVDLPHHGGHDVDRVRAGALGDAEGHGGLPRRPSPPHDATPRHRARNPPARRVRR